MLKGLDRSFASSEDVLIAVGIVYMFLRNDALRMSADEMAELSSSSNTYVRFVCTHYYAISLDKRAVDLALSLLGSGEAPLIRSAMLYEMAFCPGSEKVFLRILEATATEPLTLRREGDIEAVLDYISTAQTGPLKDVSEALKSAVAAIAKRGDIRPPGPCPLEELQLFTKYYGNRGEARDLLKAWSSQAPKQPGNAEQPK
jgi:hypothetical protein